MGSKNKRRAKNALFGAFVVPCVAHKLKSHATCLNELFNFRNDPYYSSEVVRYSRNC